MTPSNEMQRPQLEIVCLIAGDQRFGIEITAVREIRRWAPVTTLPFSDPSVLGLMNLRGAVIPIIDLSRRLGIARTRDHDRSVVIIVAREDRNVGLLVDSVSEILSVPLDALRETPVIAQGEGGQHVSGIVIQPGGMIRVIDLPALLALAEPRAA